ncbi:hypothetical protein GS534_00775 [Rhodococcus hoagii]|nr:hypothetical protein [Prescottella equi]
MFAPADEGRWDAFPRILSCERVELSTPEVPWDELPDNKGVRSVALEHVGGDSFSAVIEFVEPVPPLPRQVRSPYNGELMNAPGSRSINVIVNGGGDKSVSVGGNMESGGFFAGRLDKMLDSLVHDAPFDDSPNLLSAATISGNFLNLTFDLSAQQDFFPDGKYTPSVQVNQFVEGAPTSVFPEGEPGPALAQRCAWTDRSTSDQTRSGAQAQALSTAEPQSKVDQLNALLRSHDLPTDIPMNSASGLGRGTFFMDTQGVPESICGKLASGQSFSAALDGFGNRIEFALQEAQARRWLTDLITVYCPGNLDTSSLPEGLSSTSASTAQPSEWPGPNSAGPAPSPEFPSSLPQWTPTRSWTGTVRAFERQWTRAPGPDNLPYTAPQNHCGERRVLVRWRALNPNVSLIATNSDPREPSRITGNAGWMDLDACHVPAFQFSSSEDASNLGDVTVAIQEWQPSP